MAKLRNLSNATPEAIVKFFDGELALLGKMQAMKVKALSTKLSSLDTALGVNGLPLGRIIELFGADGCLVGGTLIDCPRDLKKYPRGIPIRDLVGKKFYTYSWDSIERTVVLSRARAVYRGRAKVYKVQLSVKKLHHNEFLPLLELIGTADHQIMLADGAYKPLCELKTKDSLKSFYRSKTWGICVRWTGDLEYKMHGRGLQGRYGYSKRKQESRFVCECLYGQRSARRYDSHHKNKNRYDNSTSNVEWLTKRMHSSHHLSENNREGKTGWLVTGVHPRGMSGKRQSNRHAKAMGRSVVRKKLSCSLKTAWSNPKIRTKFMNGIYKREKRRRLNHRVAVGPVLVGVKDVYDLIVEDTHNFVANGVFVHNSGKTSLALHVTACAQAAKGRAAYVDVEHSLNLKTAKALGVNLDSLMFNQPDSAEAALELVKKMLETKAADVLVVDSVAALTPESQEERDIGNAIPGRRALLMSNTLPTLAKLANQCGTILIFINQIRYKIGVRFGNPETTPGGMALKFYASQRLRIKKMDTIKAGGRTTGHRMSVTVVKNKLAIPYQKAFLRLNYGKGFEDELGIDDDED